MGGRRAVRDMGFGGGLEGGRAIYGEEHEG